MTEPAPVFIVGIGRSGTSLLRMMLNAHPNLYLTHEASFYLGSQFVPDRASTSDWLETYFRSLFFSWLNIDAETIRQELSSTHPPPVARHHLPDAYKAIMRACARKHNKIRYGDKTPLHSLYVDQILRDFKDARIIHMVREPKATIHSLTKMPWAPASVFLNCLYYRNCMQILGKYRGRILEIRLEDLLDDPKQTLSAILKFIGEPWNDAVLDYPKNAPADGTPTYPWLSDAFKPIVKKEACWQSELPSVWIHFIQKYLIEVYQQYGYEPMVLKSEPTHLEIIQAISSEIPGALVFAARFFQLVRKLSGRFPAAPKIVEKRLLTLDMNSYKRYNPVEEIIS